MGDPPRVYIHDGSTLERLGQLVTASEIDRSFLLYGRGAAAFTVSAADPLVEECKPQRGQVIVIESEDFREPWVGGILRVAGNRASETVSVSCQDYASILDSRYVPEAGDLNGSAGSMAFLVLALANSLNPTGIGPGASRDGGALFRGDLAFIRASEAIQEISESAGLEWWVSAEVTPGTIDLRLNITTGRGADRTEEVSLVSPGNASVSDWSIEGGAATWAVAVVGGASSAVLPVVDSAVARQEVLDVVPTARHGFVSETGIEVPNPLNKADKVVLFEAMSDQGLVLEAARARAGDRLREPNRKISVSVLGPTWPRVEVGDVVHLQTAGVLLEEAIDTPARVHGLQPDEEEGVLDLVVEIVRRAV